MPRIQLSKVDARNYRKYLRDCFAQDQEIKTLYLEAITDNSIRGTRRTKFFKQWFLCALEKFNDFPSNNKMNKQKLYSVLFTCGFPMGFIAKILLDGNLGPIRSSILLYKSDIKNILEEEDQRDNFLNNVIGDAVRSMPSSENTPLKFYQMLLYTCYIVGGLGLARKLTNSEDIVSFVNNYPEPFNGSIDFQPMIGYTLYPATARRFMAELESEASGERGQRRTGVTTSRDVVGREGSVSRRITLPTPSDIVTIERQTIPASTSAIVTAPPPPAPAQPTQPRQAGESRKLIRDMPFTNAHSVGIELEYFGPTRPALIKSLKKYGVECIDDRYGHSVPRTFKIVSDGSLTNYNSPNNDELVSPPMFGIRGLTLVKKAFMGIRDAGVLVNQEGGLHVHFGAKNNGQVWDMKTWENLIRNYNGLQPIIDLMLHAGRRGNQGWAKNLNKVVAVIDRDFPQGFNNFQDVLRCYCRAIGESESTINLTNPRFQGRYHAINPFAFINQTTCEFRQSGPTTETDTTMNWIWFLHFLIELSKRKTLTVFNWANVENFLPLSLATFWANRIWDLSPDSNELKKEIAEFRNALQDANFRLPSSERIAQPRQRVDNFSQNIAKEFLSSSNRG
jgi:hypothetical protein